MTSTQHAAHHSKYPLSGYPSADLRLPSLKDLNFYRPPPGNPQDSLPSSHNPPPNEFAPNASDHVARHPQWSRSNPPAAVQGSMPAHSQHAQSQSQQPHHSSSSLSNGHEMAPPSIDYSKHDGVYARPGLPLSAQVTPIPGSVTIGPTARGDDPPPHSPMQNRRPRPPSSVARDSRSSHYSQNTYPSPYNSYSSNQPHPNSPYHNQVPNQNHAPQSGVTSPHELNHNIPVSNHPGYNGYQQQHYVQRQPVHTSHTPHPQSLPHQPPSHASSQHGGVHIHPPQSAPVQPSSQPSAHPSLLPPSQQAHPQSHSLPQPHQLPPHHTQPQISNHNAYPSSNAVSHPPPNSWGQPPPTQPPAHHQPLPTPIHAQQQPAVQPPPHPHHVSHPASQPISNHHQPSAMTPLPSQPMVQHQHPPQQHYQHQPPQQHAPPPPLQQPPPPQHQPQHTQVPAPISHHPQYPPPPQQPYQQPQHQQQPQQPPPQPPPPQQLPFSKAAALVPPSVESRNPYPNVAEPDRMVEHNEPMIKIVKYCNALYAFASHWATVQQNMPHVQPSSTELHDMSQKALQVVRLLEDFRRTNIPQSERNKLAESMHGSPDDHRAPKRPWEDMSQDTVVNGDLSGVDQQQVMAAATKAQTTAEQDMEIIRTKRATSTAGANNASGQTKSKYRKRSRATPPGKCHSCNIKETPEWRRGPDGARTLCNACGLHYAKLMRKRDKADPTGQTPRIDLETLRASARAAEADKGARAKHKNMPEPSSPVETKPNPQQHHQGSFQLMNVITQEPSSVGSDQNRIIPPPLPQNSMQSTANLPVPPPPWAMSSQQGQPPSSASAIANGRGYAPEHLQHQSFMRSSQASTR